jgi:hypothetical protein
VPIHYERDDARQRLVVIVEGPFQKSDMLACLERQRADGTWSYGALYDFRRMTGTATFDDLREIMGQATSHPETARSRGPAAIVANEQTVYELACRYAALGRSRLTIEVFRDRIDADRWLTAQTNL